MISWEQESKECSEAENREKEDSWEIKKAWSQPFLRKHLLNHDNFSFCFDSSADHGKQVMKSRTLQSEGSNRRALLKIEILEVKEIK